jgi:putative SOS response-associated peptidase YedK
MINARAETAAEKPSFRAAFKRRRCLVPATGYYEWIKGEGKAAKTPYHVRRRDGAPFAMAGLWESWVGADGSELETATILTTSPNALVAPLHHRMPVILSQESWGSWLGEIEASRPELETLLVPAPEGPFEAYPVSRYVNSPRNEGATCIEPAGES